MSFIASARLKSRQCGNAFMYRYSCIRCSY